MGQSSGLFLKFEGSAIDILIRVKTDIFHSIVSAILGETILLAFL